VLEEGGLQSREDNAADDHQPGQKVLADSLGSSRDAGVAFARGTSLRELVTPVMVLAGGLHGPPAVELAKAYTKTIRCKARDNSYPKTFEGPVHAIFSQSLPFRQTLIREITNPAGANNVRRYTIASATTKVWTVAPDLGRA